MAPEVFVGEGVSPRSDVYGLAATVWALLVGKPPSYRDPTRLTKVCDGLTEDAEQTLRQALDLHPEKRVASAAALAAALGTPLDDPGSGGDSLSVSVAPGGGRAQLQEEIVRTAAGVFEAAAVSIALVDARTKELVYQAGWGAGADEIVGVRLPEGAGLAGAVVTSGRA